MLGDWDRPYLTMDFKTEANIIRALGKIISNGHLLKGAKPVHWCTDCGSSLAEAEVEYYDKTSPSIDVSFHAADAAAVAAKFGVSHFNGTISWLSGPPLRGPCRPTVRSRCTRTSPISWCRLTASA